MTPKWTELTAKDKAAPWYDAPTHWGEMFIYRESDSLDPEFEGTFINGVAVRQIARGFEFGESDVICREHNSQLAVPINPVVPWLRHFSVVEALRDAELSE